ncbi:MAG: hypothetical protein WCK84_09910 [Bacteroidota bacterium]
MKTSRIVIISLIIMCSAYTSFSQIMFQNMNREAVYVAFARYVNNGTSGFWVTKGWSRVSSGTSIKAFDAINLTDSIGYFVIARISETEYPGTRNLLVHINEQFLINNADQELVSQNNPDYEWRQFRLIRLQSGKTSGTISFKD